MRDEELFLLEVGGWVGGLQRGDAEGLEGQLLRRAPQFRAPADTRCPPCCAQGKVRARLQLLELSGAAGAAAATAAEAAAGAATAAADGAGSDGGEQRPAAAETLQR